MSEGALTTICELLECPQGAAPNAFLYCETGQIHINSIALIDRDGLYDPDYIPELASLHGLAYLMMTDTYNDVRDNLKLQISDPSLEQRFQALVFYVENDAFKVW